MRIHIPKRLAVILSFALSLLLSPAFSLASAAPEPPELQVAQAAGGILKVYSNVTGARVLLNGEEQGQTPLIRLLNPGRYTVRLELSGYEAYQEDIEIETGKAVTINAQLARIVGSIEVSANVDGAVVFLDGREVGRTPNAILEDLMAGTYQIQVTRPGYQSYSGSITVNPNVRIKLRVGLVPNAATVTFRSNLEGASVILNGEEIGQTPLTLDALSAGRHALVIQKAGVPTFYRVFQVEIGQKLEINAELGDEGGGLRVRTKVPGAKVFLEGNLLGETPLETEKLAIRPGEYSLRMTREGYADYIQPVVIEPNRMTRISATLMSLESAQQGEGVATRDTRVSRPLTEQWWFWSAIGGVALAAAGGTTAAVIFSQDGAAAGTGDVVVSLP